MHMRKFTAGALLAYLLMLSPSAYADIMCRYDNLFREDLSHLVKDKIRWDKTAGTISFTELGEEWREVCLTSLSQYGYSASETDNVKFIAGTLGKDICREDDSEIIALFYDHSSNALKLSLSNALGISDPAIRISYRTSGAPEGYRQCGFLPNAIARCVPIEGEERCLFMFSEGD